MNNNNNILLLSVGTRNKVVQYFKQELNGKGRVIATDSSRLAPALYDADDYHIVPSITDEGYVEEILRICSERKVSAVLSLIDPELSVLARHVDRFTAINVLPIISDYSTVELCLDKYAFFEHLNLNGIPTIKTFNNKHEFYDAMTKGEISYPVFLKPRKGSASLNISLCDNKGEIEARFDDDNGLLIQEYMTGEEYGVDAYVDMLSGELVDMFAKQKLRMRAGETDKSVSVVDDVLFDLVKDLVRKTGVRGVVDIDLFKVDGKYYASEINPRFGGGYPHAHECGVNIPKMIVNNALGNTNEPEKIAYESGIAMMKYNELVVRKVE